ncbi:MAG: hypothetical protein ABIB79_00725 [archaeon]
MKIKDCPCWFKGGLVLSGIILAIIIIAFFLPSPIFSLNKDEGSIGMIFSFPFYMGVFIAAFLLKLFEESLSPITLDFLLQFLTVIFSLIGYFLIGALVGGICGRLKERGKQSFCKINPRE